MRVVCLPADATGCGLYRIIAPSQAVRQIRPDWQIELYRPGDLKMSLLPDGRLQSIRGLPDPHGVDLLITQRAGKAAQVEFADWMQRHGTAVIIDADDALWCIDKENKAHRSWNNQKQHWRWVDTAAQHADLTTVTTQALARRYGEHGRVEVIPNRIPEGVFDLPSVRPLYPPRVAVGWAGFTSSHPRDLNVVGNAVADAVTEHDVAVRIIGDGKGVAAAWNLDPHRVEITGGVEISRYHSTLTAIDIALVPLEDSPFNRAKSYLKAAEFMSAGLPVIASPTPANRELAKVTPLLLAASPVDWREHLRQLITDPVYRYDLGKQSREAMRPLALELHAEQWARAWERAVTRRQKMSA